MNRKISATVGWMQMSAPNVSLYALTIMAQPSFEEEHPDVTQFQRMHRMIYLPCMHFLFGLCILGILASVVSLIVRWKDCNSSLPSDLVYLHGVRISHNARAFLVPKYGRNRH